MAGKLIVVEGMDGSLKNTQSKQLIERLKKDGIPIQYFRFPMYDSPTGRIVGGPFLGKMKDETSYFQEPISSIDPKVAALYYAADRRYHIEKITSLLSMGVHVILERSTYSNMAYQGGKIVDTNDRLNMYAWLDVLEFKLLELPKPEIAIFLHVPYEVARKLKFPDGEGNQREKSYEVSFRQTKLAYKELAQNYHWKTIECVIDGSLKSTDEINDELYIYVKEELAK